MAKYRGITFLDDKGLFMGRFQYKGERYTVYGKTQKETAEKMDELKHEVKHGLYCKPQNITLNQFFSEWIEEKARTEIRQTTEQAYRNVYSIHIQKVLGNKRLSDIPSMALRNLINVIAAEGWYTTANHAFVILNAIFKLATDDNLIPVNPMLNVHSPKKKKGEQEEQRVLSREEQEIFLKYAAGSLYNDFFVALLCSGCRVSEMAALRWEDCDLDRNEIRITGTMVYIRGKGRFRHPPKTEAGKRTIPLLPTLKEIIIKQRKEQLENRMALGADYIETEGFETIVFRHADGGAFWHKDIYSALEKITKRIRKDYPDFEPIHPHTLRHTFATRWLEGGGSLKTLQKILGHSNFAMTADLYSHVLPDTKHEEMKKAMGGLF